MTWFKKFGGAFSAAFLFGLAVFAAMSAQGYKDKAKKWADKAIDIEENNVTEGTLTAKVASSQAKIHDAKADERNAKTEARITEIGEHNAPIADVLDRWSKS